MSSGSANPPPATAKYLLAGAVILGVPLAVIALRLSTPAAAPPIAPVPSASSAPRQAIARVDLEVTSPTPGAQVKVGGETHAVPFTGDVAASSTEPTQIELSAPGHQGRVFKILMDRPRRLAFALPAGSGTQDATLEEIDQAFNADEGELVVGPADAGDEAGAHRSAAAASSGSRRHSLSGSSAAAATATAEARPTTTAVVATATPPPEPAPAATSQATAAPTATAAPAEAPVLKPGTVEPKAVRATVRAHSAEVQTCYDRAHLETPDLHGRLTVEAQLAPNGQVQSAHTASSDIRSARLESCILAAFRTWTFPAPAGGVAGTVTYSFVFKE